MPTNTFHNFGSDDVIEAIHVSEMHNPILNLERGASYFGGLSGGSGSAYTASLTPAPDNPYSSGMIVNFKAHVQNLAGSPDVTLDVNGVGPKPIQKNGGAPLAAGDIKANQIVSVIYDNAGTGKFHLMSVAASSSASLDDLTDVSISSPTAGQVLLYNGTNFVNGNPPGFHLFGTVPGTILHKRFLNNSSGTVTVGSPPSGKRWLIMQCSVVCPTGMSGSPAFNAGFKFPTSSSFMSLGNILMSPGTASAVTVRRYPILESVDILCHTATASGFSVFYEILEFPTTVPLYTVKLTTLSSGSNLLYTCPAGKTAQPVIFEGAGSYLSFSGGMITYFNGSLSNRMVSYNLCKSGESANAPGVGSNSLVGSSQTIVYSASFPLSEFKIQGGLEAGDFVAFRTDSAVAAQWIWMNVQEFG